MANEAREFSTGTNYAAGDLAIYNGVLYRFTAAHSAGAWDPSDAARVDNSAEQQIAELLSAYDAAMKGKAYVDTAVFAPALISGTRYRYIFTNAPDPRA